MDLSTILYGGIGGGGGAALGGFLAVFIQKLRGKSFKIEKDDILGAFIRGGLAGGLAVLGMNVLPAAYKNMSLPRLVPMGTSDFGESAVIYQSLQKHDPKAYERLIKPLDRVSRKGNVSPESLQESRLVLDEILNAKRKNANLTELRKETELSLRLFSILKDKAPEVCVKRAHGRPFQVLTELLPEDYQKQERDVLVALIEPPHRPDDVVLDIENGSNLFTGFVQSTISELGVINLDPPENDVSAQKTICELLKVLNEKTLSSSDQDVYDIYAHLSK